MRFYTAVIKKGNPDLLRGTFDGFRLCTVVAERRVMTCTLRQNAAIAWCVGPRL